MVWSAGRVANIQSNSNWPLAPHELVEIKNANPATPHAIRSTYARNVLVSNASDSSGPLLMKQAVPTTGVIILIFPNFRSYAKTWPKASGSRAPQFGPSLCPHRLSQVAKKGSSQPCAAVTRSPGGFIPDDLRHRGSDVALAHSTSVARIKQNSRSRCLGHLKRC